MNTIAKIIIEAVIVFTIIFLFNYLLFVKKNKKLNEKDMPLELIYLSSIYGIDPKKIDFRKFQYAYCIINSFIITIAYMLVLYLIKNIILKIVIGIVLIILLIIISYGLLGRYYKYKEEKSTKK